MSDLHRQIEAAFNYRGNVTCHLTDGTTCDGFLFNREFRNPRLKKDQFVELYLAGSGEKKILPFAKIKSIELSGEDHAAGKSYEEWLAKHGGK